jgi:hypothetical protein
MAAREPRQRICYAARMGCRSVVALGICGFVLATNPLGFRSSEAHAEPTRAERLVPVGDSSDELAPKPPPNCANATGKGKWVCVAKGTLHDTTKGKAPCAQVGQHFYGPAVRGASQAEACTGAKHALNSNIPQGCYPKHVDCNECYKTK